MRDIHIGAGSSHTFTTLYTVPTGKRLVMEYNSFVLDAQTGQHLSALIATFDRIGVVAGEFPPPLHFDGSNASIGLDYFSSGEVVKAYVDAGGNVSASLDRDSTSGTAGGTITVSGYLVDVP